MRARHLAMAAWAVTVVALAAVAGSGSTRAQEQAADAALFGAGVGDRSGGDPGGACPPATKFGEGTFSSDKFEWRITFSPTRLLSFWTVSDGFFPFTRESTIVTSRWGPRGWSTPEVASFSGTYPDIDPFITPDGLTLFFSSIRPVNGVAREDIDLWMVRRTWNGWSDPVHLGDAVNSPGDELYSSADLWGNLYFASDRDGQFDIYRSRRGLNGTYAPAEKIPGGVNTPDGWEFNPEISPDGRTLLFTGNFRSDLLGFGDLYISHLRRDEFTPARNLGPCVNSAADEYHPTMLWERKRLIFVRNLNGPTGGDFYQIRLPIH